ncbi:MAG: FAD-dependent monooxygenase, partial [Acidobacteriaceae bacterium]|nr:FAD-dependent monooxygenase [Acidobacteriaceae bacterium]
FGIVNYGKALILINRGDYSQAGFIIRKGSFDEMRRNGIEAFRHSIAQIAPHLRDRVDELQDWDQIKLLSVQINRLRRWYRPGLLCIGDAAHAMSPAGGVGINLAIQDAVAAAKLLARPLLERSVMLSDLAAVQRRREFPTRVTQRLQVNAHKGFDYAFRHSGPLKAPLPFKIAVGLPGTQRMLGYAVGIGVRPEHIAGRRPECRNRLQRIAVCAGVAAALTAGLVWLVKRRCSATSARA